METNFYLNGKRIITCSPEFARAFELGKQQQAQEFEKMIEKIKVKVLTDWKGQNEFIDWLQELLKDEFIDWLQELLKEVQGGEGK
jgi:hypothetical protein